VRQHCVLPLNNLLTPSSSRYRVDRQKSVDVLKLFLSRKAIILEVERQWLLDIGVHAVLSDAAFLGWWVYFVCFARFIISHVIVSLAAKAAGIPSILITNFTFDSVYSFLSTSITDALTPQEPAHLAPSTSPTAQHQFAELTPDVPVSPNDLEPLVEQIHAGYRCAELLLLLPGNIPIPSFSMYPPLPSRDWVDVHLNTFYPKIIEFLSLDQPSCPLYPSIPFSQPSYFPRKERLRSVIPAPLIVRSPASVSSVYTAEGRSRLLTSVGVPIEFHDPERTKVLVVSFGGQIFRKPSRGNSRSQSRNGSRVPSPEILSKNSSTDTINDSGINGLIPGICLPPLIQKTDSPDIHNLEFSLSELQRLNDLSIPSVTPPRLATPSHIWIPGAPPASKPPVAPTPPVDIDVPLLATIPPTPKETGYFDLGDTTHETEEVRLLPNSSWIAIVCGVSKDQWDEEGDDEDTGLPGGFFVAPKDVYMPDLTAASDVLLGKLVSLHLFSSILALAASY
jgi:hypothetical protein